MINCWYFKISKNKGIEFQISRWHDSKYFDASIWHRDSSCDHKGLELTLTLFRIEFRVDFYDHRHREHY